MEHVVAETLSMAAGHMVAASALAAALCSGLDPVIIYRKLSSSCFWPAKVPSHLNRSEKISSSLQNYFPA